MPMCGTIVAMAASDRSRTGTELARSLPVADQGDQRAGQSGYSDQPGQGRGLDADAMVRLAARLARLPDGHPSAWSGTRSAWSATGSAGGESDIWWRGESDIWWRVPDGPTDSDVDDDVDDDSDVDYGSAGFDSETATPDGATAGYPPDSDGPGSDGPGSVGPGSVGPGSSDGGRQPRSPRWEAGRPSRAHERGLASPGDADRGPYQPWFSSDDGGGDPWFAAGLD
jgi:hypothetical protein